MAACRSAPSGGNTPSLKPRADRYGRGRSGAMICGVQSSDGFMFGGFRAQPDGLPPRLASSGLA
jgi:hypothetical protein